MVGNQELLQSVPLFARLPRETIERLGRLAIERHFDAGADIISEGDAGVGFFLILSGSAEVRHKGNPQPIRRLGPGDYFGELALLDGRPRSATVTASEPVRCLALSRWDFRAEVSQNSELSFALLEALSLRLRSNEAPAD